MRLWVRSISATDVDYGGEGLGKHEVWSKMIPYHLVVYVPPWWTIRDPKDKGNQSIRRGSKVGRFVRWFLPRSKGRKDTLCTLWNIYGNMIPSAHVQLKSE